MKLNRVAKREQYATYERWRYAVQGRRNKDLHA